MEKSIDEEFDSSLNLVDHYRRFAKAEPIPRRRHPQPSELPPTITILKDPITDATVYLVGTAHFRSDFSIQVHSKNKFIFFSSEKSQREVTQVCSKRFLKKRKFVDCFSFEKIIEMSQPDVVMVELCQNRVNVLSLDEQTLLRDASEMNYTKLRSIIKAVKQK